MLRVRPNVWWLTVAMAVAASALTFTALYVVDSVDHVPAIPWWCLAVAFAATEVFVVLLRSEKGAQSISLSEIPLVVGLAFTGPLGLLVARVSGAGAVVGIHRRQRGVKLAFNLVHFWLEAATALVIYQLVLGDGEPGDPRGWAAAFAATLLIDVLGAFTISAAISLHGGGWDWGEVRGSVLEGASAAVGNTSLALVAVLVLERDVRAAWLLIVVATILHVAYRAYTALGQGHARLEQLYGFTSEVGRSMLASSVQETVLEHARAALGATSAGLVLVDAGGRPASMVEMAQDGSVSRRDGGFEVDPWWRPAIGGDGVLLSRKQRRRDGTSDDARDAIAVALAGEEGVHGVLFVEGRLDDVATFTVEDMRLLETIANHARVSLDRTDLVERLRRTAVEQTHQATHDHLTGLPNRRGLATAITEALGEQDGRQVAVVLIDLDRFKEINDTLGHHMGDEVLREVGERLANALEPGSSVARLGGDEFALVVVDADRHRAEHEARRILDVLTPPFAVGGLRIDVGGSAGVAVAPADGTDVNSLLQRADVAMYDAKEHNTGVAVYSPERDHYSPGRLALVGELRSAIDDGSLRIVYQPKVSVATGRISGVEALVRWPHPTHGLVPPDEFIPLAEHTGLIRPLTRFVLTEAFEQVSRWAGEGLDLTMSVNISARDLADQSLPDLVRDVLLTSGADPGLITLEITEGSIMADPESSIELLHRLRSAGVQLSIDDFGTGYSSLAYLKRLPVDEVKIDKSFVLTLPSDPKDATIVASTIDLGHRLGFRVVAEGVETDAALQFLADVGCDTVQGYFLSRPIDRPAVEALLDAWSGLPVDTRV